MSSAGRQFYATTTLLEGKMAGLIKRSILAAALAAAGSLYPFSVAAEGDVSGKVTAIQSYNGHTGLLLQIAADRKNPDGCTSSNWYIFPDDSPRAAFIQSGMLAALHSGKHIWINLSGCYQGYPLIRHVNLLP
jgi:hypothetical protein